MRGLSRVTLAALAVLAVSALAFAGEARVVQGKVTAVSEKAVTVADEVTATLNELGAKYSDDVTVTIVSDLSTFIEESRDGLVKEGGLGALFAIITI